MMLTAAQAAASLGISTRAMYEVRSQARQTA